MPPARALLLVLLALPVIAVATEQISDSIVINGTREWLPFNQPFDQLANGLRTLQAVGDPPSYLSCTASWRGYSARWEIRDQRLLLIGLTREPCTPRPREVPLARLFPGQAGPVVATWYSGQLVVPMGPPQFKTPYRSLSRFSHERYLVLTVTNGAVTEQLETREVPSGALRRAQ